MTGTLTALERRMIRRRHLGLNVAPARTASGKALRVTTPYGVPGEWEAGHHTGEDYACPVGSIANAVSRGYVVEVGVTSWGPAYGLAVIVRIPDFDIAWCHLSRIDVAVGDVVRPGTELGLTGYSGNVRPVGPRGAHLHFEVRPRHGRYGSDVHPRKARRRWTPV